MKRHRTGPDVTVCLAFTICVATTAPAQESPLPIVPWPADVQRLAGSFTLDASTRIVVPDSTIEELGRLASFLADAIREATGLALVVEPVTGPVPPNTILLALDDSGGAGERAAGGAPGQPYDRNESYHLRVDGERVALGAPATAGIFYGIQTVRQLLPPAPAGGETTLPALGIRDAPRFRYRGMHLDVGRHFFPVPFVKRYIDLLAMYKLNTLHLHLTDDQGWRIEIAQYPRLTDVGSCRAETIVGRNVDPFVGDGTPYCGFYTKDEIRELVAYAAERFVNIVPEIEMPGHSLAALAAYPGLACTDGPFEVGTRWGVYEDIYCPTEETFGFLEDVLTEVMELFPSPYIHIGGDEAPKARWEESPDAQEVMAREGLANEDELQSYFVRRIEEFLDANGRRLIGWDEILEGGLAPRATVMSWRGTAGGIEAAKAGHDVIMTPNSHLYFDYYQGDRRFEPLAIGGFTPLPVVYAFEPVPAELGPREAEHIIGAQANVWTEYMKLAPHVEYMVLPRMLALAEVLWSPADARDWDAFVARLPSQFARLAALGVNFRIPEVEGLEEDRVTLSDTEVVRLSHPLPSAEIRFTLDGSVPTRSSELYSKPFVLWFDPVDERLPGGSTITVSARPFMPGGRAGPVSRARVSRTRILEPGGADAEGLVRGVNYRYYEQRFESARQLLGIDPRSGATRPARSGYASGFEVSAAYRAEDFGVVFEGYLHAPRDGIYTFYVTSDDGAVLLIGDRVVVDHDGLHGMTEKSGAVALAAGFHPVALGFFQAGGAAGLEISVKTGEGARRDLPRDWLFRADE